MKQKLVKGSRGDALLQPLGGGWFKVIGNGKSIEVRGESEAKAEARKLVN